MEEKEVILDELGRPKLSMDQALELLMQGKPIPEGSLYQYDEIDVDKYMRHYEEIYFEEPKDILYCEKEESFDEFHSSNSSNFLIPESFKQLDIEEYVLGLCTRPDELERVEQELLLFRQKNLYPILRLMVYLVDYFRKNKVIWGVGRGSSVASYVLFLIGIHKVDSIKYQLDIQEFLR